MIIENKKTVVATGSSGFIGTHLVSMLKEAGFNIIKIHHTNLAFQDAIRNTLKGQNVNYIFHLAAYGNHYHQQDNKETIEENIIGTYNLLEATKDFDYDGFVNFSTSSVLLPVQTMYSASKAGAEFIARAFATKYNKPIVSVRPASIYGEGEADFRFIPKVINSLLKNKEMEVVPEPMHDWLYVKDFIAGILLVIKNIGNLHGVSVNISTDKQYSNKEVIEMLEKIHGKKLKTSYMMERPYDTDNWKVDNSIIKALGWNPETTTPLEEGLKKVYEHIRKTNN